MNASPPRTARSRCRRRILISIAVSTASCVSLFLSVHGVERPAPPDTNVPDETTASASKASNAPECPFPASPLRENPPWLRYRPGDVLAYSLESEDFVHLTAVRDDAPTSDGAAGAGLSRTITGDLLVRVYDENESGWLMGFTLPDARVILSSTDASERDRSAVLEKELAREVLARIERSGRVERLVFPGSSSADGRNQWRALLGRWQFIFPEDHTTERWDFKEHDTTGEYLASYRSSEVADVRNVTKTKSSYTALRLFDDGGVKRGLPGDVAVDGEAVLELTDVPLKLQGQERLVVAPDGVATIVESSSRFELNLRRRATGAALDPSRALVLRSGRETTLGETEATGAAYGSESSPNSSRALESLRRMVEEKGVRSAEAIGAAGSLASALRVDPLAVDQVLDRLRRADTSSGEAALLFGVLARSSCARCQAVLMEVFSDPEWPASRRRSALLSAALVERPVAELEGALAGLFEEGGHLSSSALLALGAVGGRVRADSARFDAIGDYLEEIASRTQDRSRLILSLEALGNYGPREVPAPVQRALTHADATVREAAARALTRTEDTRADRYLLDLVRGDSSEDVRLAAVDVLGARGSEFLGAVLRELLLGGDSETMREGALRNVSGALSRDGELRAVVEWAAENDSSPQIRVTARQLLKG